MEVEKELDSALDLAKDMLEKYNEIPQPVFLAISQRPDGTEHMQVCSGDGSVPPDIFYKILKMAYLRHCVTRYMVVSEIWHVTATREERAKFTEVKDMPGREESVAVMHISNKGVYSRRYTKDEKNNLTLVQSITPENQDIVKMGGRLISLLPSRHWNDLNEEEQRVVQSVLDKFTVPLDTLREERGH